MADIRPPTAHSRARRISPPSFPRKRESTTSAWTPDPRSTPPGMTVGMADIRTPSAHPHARRTGPPSFSRKRESTTSAWIPGLRSTPPGMTRRSGAADIRSPSTHSHARRISPPSFPRKRESSTSAWIPDPRSTPPGMAGDAGAQAESSGFAALNCPTTGPNPAGRWGRMACRACNEPSLPAEFMLIGERQ